LQAPPIIFKGGGFYVTENRHENGEGEKSVKPAAKTPTKPLENPEKSK